MADSTEIILDNLTSKMTEVLSRVQTSPSPITDSPMVPISIKLDGSNYGLWSQVVEMFISEKDKLGYCNTPKYTIVVFDMFRVFCKHNLTVSRVKCETWKRETWKFIKFKDKIVIYPKRDLKSHKMKRLGAKIQFWELEIQMVKHGGTFLQIRQLNPKMGFWRAKQGLSKI